MRAGVDAGAVRTVEVWRAGHAGDSDLEVARQTQALRQKDRSARGAGKLRAGQEEVAARAVGRIGTLVAAVSAIAVVARIAGAVGSFYRAIRRPGGGVRGAGDARGGSGVIGLVGIHAANFARLALRRICSLELSRHAGNAHAQQLVVVARIAGAGRNLRRAVGVQRGCLNGSDRASRRPPRLCQDCTCWQGNSGTTSMHYRSRCRKARAGQAVSKHVGIAAVVAWHATAFVAPGDALGVGEAGFAGCSRNSVDL